MEASDTLAQLAQIPDMADELWASGRAAGDSGDPKPGQVRPHRAKPSTPIDLGRHDILRTDEHGLLSELSQAVRAVWEDHPGVALSNPPTWAGECSWLLANVALWDSDPFLSAFVSDAAWLVWRTLDRALHRPAPARLTCPACGGRLAESAGGWVTCRDCASQFPGRERIVQALRRHEPMTTDQAAKYFRIDPHRIQVWHSRGLIKPTNPGCKPLEWDLWEILRILRPNDVEEVESQCCNSA
ncbi:hypothetical protein FAM23868_001979 [Propionibacterium freudenreichii]|uniref:hypothetical protein n=1 Tax=Propionibacterium freudenreichii TaxID=1744 RepID=UPI00254B687F|nr:hypothetical protein [Propionibacterium freudenreichii]MDK9332639.1 hypothetical protein [Propionibacterium freudenreichii]